MANLKLGIAVVLAFVVFVAYVAPIWAVDYNPGVSVGQWVKYGNIVATGTGTEELNKTSWVLAEVTSVSGKNVTLHMTGKFINGSDIVPSSEFPPYEVINVETGTINGSSSGGLSFLIAANLQQGDNLTNTATSSYIYKINSTATRTYMGASRSCNICNVTTSGSYGGSSYGSEFFAVWDQASGVLMEMKIEESSGGTTIEKMSFSATDTNLFSTGAAGWLVSNLIYVVAAVVIIIVVIGVVAVMMMRRKPQAPTTETTTKT